MKDRAETLYSACYYSLYVFVAVVALMIVFFHS